MATNFFGEHDSDNTETFIRHDCNGNTLVIGKMATVSAHGDVPAFRGEYRKYMMTL